MCRFEVSAMPMLPYTVYCYGAGCPHPAVYKVAARWSDGVTEELKTYGLFCAQCLPEWFRRSLAKQQACRRASNEILEPPGIYRLQRGRHDAELERLVDRERRLLAESS
jgi:hypothetical protein